MKQETFWRRMLARWRAVAIAVAVGTAILCVVPLAVSVAGSEESPRISAEERIQQIKAKHVKSRTEGHRDWENWIKNFDEKMDRLGQQREEENLRIEDTSKRPKRRVRKIRRFRWESPASTRGRIWNVPEEESEQETLNAFLRICIAEADGHLQDCVGIWQVFKNIRRRTCSRGMVRRITECEEGTGETMLSVMRRSQRHIMGMIPLRNKRAAWISKMTTDCENPPDQFYPGLSEAKRLNYWDSRYQQRCSYVVQLGRHLLKGELPPDRPGVRLRWLSGKPITWGGRCETEKASCDDRIACARKLARIPETDTHNAFWCRPGRPGCAADDIDPICIKLGYPSLLEPETTVTKAEPTEVTDPQT